MVVSVRAILKVMSKKRLKRFFCMGALYHSGTVKAIKIPVHSVPRSLAGQPGPSPGFPGPKGLV